MPSDTVVLPSTEKQLVRLLQTEGVLQKVDPFRLDQREGAIITTCGSAEQFPDIFEHQQMLCRHHRSHPQLHCFAWNGGPLIIHPSSPLHQPGVEEFVSWQIGGAVALKPKIKTFLHCGHWPCGLANTVSMSLLDAMHYEVLARQWVGERWPHLNQSCFFAIEFWRKPDGEMSQETRHISIKEWLAYTKDRFQRYSLPPASKPNGTERSAHT